MRIPFAILTLFLALFVALPARASTLTISPSPTRVDAGGHIAFVAAGGSGAGYVFSLSAPSGGAITSAGEYTAGALGGVVDVVTVTDSGGDSATANVDVISTLTISGTTSVAIGNAQTLVAAGGNGTYTWSLSTNASGGSITTSGAYTAGLHGDVTDVVLLTDGAGNTAALSIRVASGLTITPAAPRIAPGTTIGFVASGGSGGNYAFSLVTNASGASLNAFGVYIAGKLAGVTDVIEVTDGDGNVKTAAITVAPIAISPSNATVVAGLTRAFVADGGSGGGYVWSLSINTSGGSVNAFGIYTAGLTAGVDELRVEDATGNASTTRITVTGPKISPINASVAVKARLGFVAEGGSGIYTWSLVTNASGGTINDFGIYVAGSIAGTTDVVQVEDSRGNRSTVNVTITGGPTIAPSAPSLTIGATQGFVASGGSGSGYRWSLVRGSGKINAFGVFTAGDEAGTNQIEVVDSEGSKSTTTITVTSGLAIAPSSPVVYQGATFGFVARGGVGEGYKWSISTNATGATITELGVYTAGTTDAGANATDEVRVTDGAGNAATMAVTVLPPMPNLGQADGGLVFGARGGPSDDSGCGVAGGSSSGAAGLLFVLAALVLRRRRA